MFNVSFFKFLFGFTFIILASFGVIFVAGYLNEREHLSQEAASVKALSQ